MELIKATNISYKFDNTLYENVNLSLCSGESIAILGISGSGKSTLLNNLSTLLQPLSGSVDLCGICDIYSKNTNTLLKLRRDDVGIIFQSHYLFRGFSALENLQVASILSNQNINHTLLKRFGISHILDNQIGELSGGQQQRLSIARVLTKKPKVIFADELTGNLDRENTINVMNIIFDYIRINNAAMVIATHDNEVAKMCDRQFLLKDKKLSSL